MQRKAQSLAETDSAISGIRHCRSRCMVVGRCLVRSICLICILGCRCRLIGCKEVTSVSQPVSQLFFFVCSFLIWKRSVRSKESYEDDGIMLICLLLSFQAFPFLFLTLFVFVLARAAFARDTIVPVPVPMHFLAFFHFTLFGSQIGWMNVRGG